MTNPEAAWFYIKPGTMGDAQAGPVTTAELMELVRSKQVRADTRVASAAAAGGQWVVFRTTDAYKDLLTEQAERRRHAAEAAAQAKALAAAPRPDKSPSPPGLSSPPSPAPSNAWTAAPTQAPSPILSDSGSGSESRPQLLEADNLISGLLDLSLSRFVTPQILRILWTIVLILAGLAGLAVIGGSVFQIAAVVYVYVSPPETSPIFRSDANDSNAALIAVVLGVVLAVVQLVVGLLTIFCVVCLIRTAYEVIFVLFDMAQSLRRLRQRSV